MNQKKSSLQIWFVIILITTVLIDTKADICLPTPTGFVVVGKANNSVVIDWNPVDRSTYEIQYRVKGANTWQGPVSSRTSSVKLTGLLSSTTYEYRVRGVYSFCTSEWSAIKQFVTGASTCDPTPPTNLAVARVGCSTANMQWSTVFDATYEVSYKKDADGTWEKLTTGERSLLLVNLDPNTAYAVRIRSKCADGSYSAWTSTVSFSTFECTMPQIQSSIDPDSVRLRWPDYDIDFVKYDGISASDGKTYYVQYRVWELAGWSGWSNEYTDSRTYSLVQATFPTQVKVTKICGALRSSRLITIPGKINFSLRSETEEETSIVLPEQIEEVHIKVLNEHGHVVLSKKDVVRDSKYNLNDPVKDLPKGLYIIDMQYKDQRIVKKVIKTDF